MDGDFFLHEGVCDTARKVAFAGCRRSPQNRQPIFSACMFFPMLRIPPGNPRSAGFCRCRSQKSSPAWRSRQKPRLFQIPPRLSRWLRCSSAASRSLTGGSLAVALCRVAVTAETASLPSGK